MNLRTLNDVFFSIIQHDRPRVIVHRKNEAWIPISAQELRVQIVRVSQALLNWGVRKGDRVAILSENRPEWAIADFASLLVGGVVVPIYATLTAEQTAYALRDSGARIVFVSSEKQLKKICEILAPTTVEKIVVMDSFAPAPISSGDIVLLQNIAEHVAIEREAEIETLANSMGPGDLATIIYTSGTTGTPKGAILTHGNMASNLSCSLRGFDLNPGDVSLSFLPLSHVTARHVDYAMLCHGVTICYVPFLDNLPRALNEIRPTILVSVPRLYEKIHTQVELKTRNFPKQQIYRWALSVGKTHRNETLSGKPPSTFSWNLASRLLFSKVRAGLGGRVRIFISGGAPLGRELAEWYANVGIRIHEGYGLTETSPVIAVNSPEDHKIGTVGKPLANVDVRIADDGEILVRGPSIFHGYWNKPDETQAVFIGDWFKTGDIGNLDADGFLSVTDRKKDLIKTSGGKFIAPQPIENSLKHNAFVAEAVVLGDKHKFPAALISPDFAVLEKWAGNNGVVFSSHQELVANVKTQALYEGIVDVTNKDLARFEKLKKVILVADEFTSDNGLLTASMKMRRRVVEERYRERIADMYARAEESGPAS